MSLRTFILGLSASFGVAWLAVVVIPYFKMRDLAPVPSEAADGDRHLHPETRRPCGRWCQGLCRKRLLPLPHPGGPPTYAGNDLYRPTGAASRPTRPRRHPPRNQCLRLRARNSPRSAWPAWARTFRTSAAASNPYARASTPSLALPHLYNPRAEPEALEFHLPAHPFLFENAKSRATPRRRPPVEVGRNTSWSPTPMPGTGLLPALPQEGPSGAGRAQFRPGEKDGDS
jgi:cytochrome c oxidase cbb3-type subunit II